MLGVEREDLIAGLNTLACSVCGYTAPGKPLAKRCDCKYVFNKKLGGEYTGCPEIRSAIRLIEALTPVEYVELCGRAGVRLPEDR